MRNRRNSRANFKRKKEEPEKKKKKSSLGVKALKVGAVAGIGRGLNKTNEVLGKKFIAARGLGQGKKLALKSAAKGLLNGQAAKKIGGAMAETAIPATSVALTALGARAVTRKFKKKRKAKKEAQAKASRRGRR